MAFGDGGDGAIVAADSPLTVDTFATTVTTAAGDINTANYRLFATESITVAAGTFLGVHADFSTWITATEVAAGSLGGGAPGAAGGVAPGGAGDPGNSTSDSLCGNGVSGSNGADTGAAGTSTAISPANGSPWWDPMAHSGKTLAANQTFGGAGGPGGDAGPGIGEDGGAGGAGGGCLILGAPAINIAGTVFVGGSNSVGLGGNRKTGGAGQGGVLITHGAIVDQGGAVDCLGGAPQVDQDVTALYGDDGKWYHLGTGTLSAPSTPAAPVLSQVGADLHADWAMPAGAARIEFQIAADDGFAAILDYAQEHADVTSYVNAGTPPGPYYVRIRALATLPMPTGRVASAWSDTASITIV